MVNLVYAATLLGLGLAPQIPGVGTAVSDGLVHAIASGAQALILFWLLTVAVSPMPAVIFSGLGASLFGGIIEVLQLLQPSRYFQVSDLEANAVGSILVCIAISLTLVFNRHHRGRTR